MVEKEDCNIIQLRIIEFEDNLMDLIEISSNSEYILIPVFEIEMNIILKEIDYLETLID